MLLARYSGPERRATPRAPGRIARAVARGLRGALAVFAMAGLGSASARVPDRSISAPERPRGLEDRVEWGSLAPASADDEATRDDVPVTAAAKPPTRHTSALTPALRVRGWNACMTPDHGFGGYRRWQNLSMGQVLLPEKGGHDATGGYDVVVHFHGHEAVRKPFVEVASGTVLVGIDLGVGSGPYEDAFALAAPWTELKKSLTAALVKHSGRADAHVAHLALSSWSAGYGAVVGILRHFPDDPDAVILLDSLHTGYVKGPPHDMAAMHGVHVPPIAPLLSYARRAAAGQRTLFLTHSDVRPVGYASTGEVADYLVADAGGWRAPAMELTPLGIELRSTFDHGGLHVRGYDGRNEPAHCAHVELLALLVRDVLEPTWRR